MYPYEIISKIFRALYPLRPLLWGAAAWGLISALIAIF